MKLYCVFGEVSDQYGTSSLLAVCDSPELAEEVGNKENLSQQFGRRFHVQSMKLLTDISQYKSERQG